MGIQLAHAGRKASTMPPWEEGKPLSPENGAWETVGPSAIPFAEGWHVPVEMTLQDIEIVKTAFVDSTRKAERLGYDVIEIHGAHGYLLCAFLSPLANQREDEYGGSLENRMRYPLEIFEAVRRAWPSEKPLGMRISASDWDDAGWTIDEPVIFARELRFSGPNFRPCC